MNPDGVGVISEIREFCLHDGPGVRTSVFFKGCPLRCLWCHNPELREPGRQLLIHRALCTECGACRKICPSPNSCRQCGRCAGVCPSGSRRMCGELFTPETAAERILRDRDILLASGGGVTFTGGEVMLQAPFALALAEHLRGIPLALETCGYADEIAYRRLIGAADLVYQDIKCMSAPLHRQLTGADNRIILHNIAALKRSGKPYIIRIPLIPGMNDDPAELSLAAEFLSASPGKLIEVQLLPYHAGGLSKMRSFGFPVPETLPETDGTVPASAPEIFRRRGLPCR